LHEAQTFVVAKDDGRAHAAALAARRRRGYGAREAAPWKLVLARDGDQDWAVGLRCPCGCGQRLEMMLLKEVKPCWDLSVDRHGHVSLHPSVWLREGCKSHFWLRSGKIVWCD
jgi:hypothetical protein